MADLRNPVLDGDVRVSRAIELVWREAELLDRKDYRAWQELYAEDGVYAIPIDRDAEEFDDVLNMAYDDARMRRLRVDRMTEGYAIAAVDSAITVRTVSRFVPTAVSDAEVSLRAAQVLVAYKRGTHDLWAADVDYTIRLGERDSLVRKVIRLVNSEDAVPAAGFLL
ncbi:aromatic-ring-hydroxylating dioxygenase subunit beta [Saccharopolyspora flava]|uniref:3-phenylpropionate/cinnamic acid dioxygenase, small subunit n=1 Tax=Saccharopolyspora flava TaxID=95161 RepID=A0A1I6S569_9PSEU|nr:aromatic-ring-hydroxylating dioxygenase subunit beta [Saccharopolyspora flava]SFS72076.1 3-phenylpropionate/cinnamic acid dioxygenase, small subunit [Saccharopolyspora flava]